MKPTTLVFPRRSDGYVLLGRKKYGFGKSKWNGFGGKIQEGESIIDCALRELYEESGLRAQAEDLVEVGRLDFIFPADPELDHPANIYFVEKYEGTPCETEEMQPRWFAPDALPFDEMWPADAIWLPVLMKGKCLQGKVIFASDNEGYDGYELEETDGFNG